MPLCILLFKIWSENAKKLNWTALYQCLVIKWFNFKFLTRKYRYSDESNFWPSGSQMVNVFHFILFRCLPFHCHLDESSLSTLLHWLSIFDAYATILKLEIHFRRRNCFYSSENGDLSTAQFLAPVQICKVRKNIENAAEGFLGKIYQN